MSKFRDLPPNATPSNDDIIAIEQDVDGLNKKVKLNEIPIVTDLASTANSKGASLVSVEDAAGNFTSTNQEGVNAELYAMMDGMDEWVSATTYAIGDVVILTTNNVIYRCIVGNSDVTFTGTNWKSVGKDRLSTVDDAITGSNQTVTVITSELIRLTNVGLVSIDMIPQGIGQAIYLLNNTGSDITINNETGATTEARIKTGTGAAITVSDDQAIQIVYDETDSRWQVVSATGGGGSDIEIEDEGISLTTAVTKINFAGTGVTVTEPVADEVLVTIPSGGSSIEVEDEGISLSTAVTKFNFIGDGVVVTEPVANEMLVTIGATGPAPGAGKGVYNAKTELDEITIATLAASTNFGTDIDRSNYIGSCSSALRICFVGGGYPSGRVDISYHDFATGGAHTIFGNLVGGTRSIAGGTGSATRGLFMGGSTTGSSVVNIIEYITFASTGNSIDFGNLASAKDGVAGLNSATRSVFAGGSTSSGGGSKTIDMTYVETATTGNSISFGNLNGAGKFVCYGASNATRGLFAGGNSTINIIDYITIATTGGGTDFGDLISGRYAGAGASSKTRAVFMGGDKGVQATDMNYVEFDTLSNASVFGTLTMTEVRYGGGNSSNHGGI